jgi:WD40 repeat protein
VNVACSAQLWDLKTNKLLREWKEHTAEVYAVDWNLVNKEQLLSGAWDNVSFLSAATAPLDAS